MKIAIVIPIKNEKDSIPALADSLLDQTLRPDEVIFVDAGSTDGSIHLIEQLINRSNIFRIVRAEGAFPGAARNAGVRSTNADIIVQIDGGNLPENNEWIENLCKPILHGTAEYVSGSLRIMPIRKHIFCTEINVGEIYGASIYGAGQLRKKFPRGGASVAYLRSIWEKTGGFLEEFRFGSDPLFVKKILQMNVKTAFVENAGIYWQIGPRFINIIERQIRYQKAKFRHPDGLSRFRMTILLPLVALILMMLAFLYSFVWIIFSGLFLSYWVVSCLRTAKLLRRRSQEVIRGKKLFISAMVIALTEFVNIFSKVVGTFVSLISYRTRQFHTSKIREYLHGADHHTS